VIYVANVEDKVFGEWRLKQDELYDGIHISFKLKRIDLDIARWQISYDAEMEILHVYRKRGNE
jgi:hypothetical protein